MRNDLIKRNLLRNFRYGDLAQFLEESVLGTEVIGSETQFSQTPSTNLPLNPPTKCRSDRSAKNNGSCRVENLH